MNGYDAVDRALLAALATDPRATVVALADRLEMSRNTVQARMSRLEASGAFLSFERSIDPVPLGFPLEAFVAVHVRQKQLSPAAVSAFNPETRGPGLLRIIGTVAPGKTPAELEAAIDAEIERVKTGPIEEWEIEKARNGVRSQVISGLGSSLQRAVQLGENALFYDRPEKINTRADEIAKVSAADVQRVARTYLVKTGRTVVYTVPKPAAPTGGK